MFDLEEGDDTSIAFRDLLMLCLIVLASAVIVLVNHINPPNKASAEAGIEPPGNVIVEISWPGEWDTDADLWVKAPGDVPVGYSNKGGAVFNLLRDDLGTHGDLTKINQEIAYSRGIVPGEYVVNVHMFRNGEAKWPVPINVMVRTKKDAAASAKPILQTDIELHREGQELTAFRFRLNEDGTLQQDSVNSVYKPLRSGTKNDR